MDRITGQKIAKRAIMLGASRIGIVSIASLREAPSHRVQPLSIEDGGEGTVVVLALAHPPEQPEMDWWDNWQGGTPGNRRLVNISRRLTKWIFKKYALEALEVPYQVERSGVFLKDAATLSGLGVVGRNNLLITPQYGPRVRLRALWLKVALPGTGPLQGFDPCQGCDAPCLEACPRKAFASGTYQRESCQEQMRADESSPIALRSPVLGMATKFKIAYCRLCELSCPVGDAAPPQLGVSP